MIVKVNGCAVGSFKEWIYCPLTRAAGQGYGIIRPPAFTMENTKLGF
jgi:hypothetical protein